jgi:membrane protease YdiL (CAAX protease family)
VGFFTSTEHIEIMQATTLSQDLGLLRAPGMWRDVAMMQALCAGVAVGLALWIWMPAGYARNIWASPTALLSFLLWQPALEELLFRGALQGRFLHTGWGARRWLGVSVANVLASLLFVLLHLLHHAPLWAMAVFPPSLIFGKLRERHTSLLPALLMHSIYNAIYLFAGL